MALSTLTLYSNIPLDPRYEHSIGWGSRAAQSTYFAGKVYATLSNFSYLRKERAIKVPYSAEQLEGDINYLSTNNGGKVRYYFITSKEYVSDNVTRLYIELDVLQTYQFDWNIPACFVEREHVTNDIGGAHLLPEGLEVGEYITNGGKTTSELDELAIVCLSSVTMSNPMGEPVAGSIVSGIYSGLKLYCRSADDTGVKVVNAALSSLSTLGKAEGVQSMWMCPKAFIDADWENESNEVMLEVKGMKTLESSPFSVPTSIDGYTPRNKKLLTYPYNFLYAYNGSSGAATYRFELFSTAPTFIMAMSCSSDGVARLIPENYRGFPLDNESGISMTGYPTCAWTQDAYKIWLAQNQATQDLTVFSGGVQVALGAATMAGGAALTVSGALNPLDSSEGHGGQMMASGAQQMYSGAMQIAGVMAARKDASVQPLQAKGAQSASVNIMLNQQRFTISVMSITAEYAERLDKYFDMYGYCVNTVKTPEINTRRLWNYIKTLGCIVRGNIDTNDRRRIGEIFDRGVTFWHDPAKMYNYNLAANNTFVGVG